MRLLADRGQRLQRAGMAALVGPSHRLETRGSELGRLATDVAARRKDHLASLERMLRQRDPREVLRLRQRSLADAEARFGRLVAFVQARFALESARVVGLIDGLTSSASRTVHDRARGLESREQRLHSLGPQETLKRGYSICLDQDGRTVIRDAGQSAPGRQVEVVLAAGRLGCTVERTQP
jgi:exodeoxyribonuclease VII large subunit